MWQLWRTLRQKNNKDPGQETKCTRDNIRRLWTPDQNHSQHPVITIRGHRPESMDMLEKDQGGRSHLMPESSLDRVTTSIYNHPISLIFKIPHLGHMITTKPSDKWANSICWERPQDVAKTFFYCITSDWPMDVWTILNNRSKEKKSHIVKMDVKMILSV